MDAVTVIIDVATEKVVKRIKEVGGQDEVWYNPNAHQYYTASRDQPGGPVWNREIVEEAVAHLEARAGGSQPGCKPLAQRCGRLDGDQFIAAVDERRCQAPGPCPHLDDLVNPVG